MTPWRFTLALAIGVATSLGSVVRADEPSFAQLEAALGGVQGAPTYDGLVGRPVVAEVFFNESVTDLQLAAVARAANDPTARLVAVYILHRRNAALLEDVCFEIVDDEEAAPPILKKLSVWALYDRRRLNGRDDLSRYMFERSPEHNALVQELITRPMPMSEQQREALFARLWQRLVAEQVGPYEPQLSDLGDWTLHRLEAILLRGTPSAAEQYAAIRVLATGEDTERTRILRAYLEASLASPLDSKSVAIAAVTYRNREGADERLIGQLTERHPDPHVRAALNGGGIGLAMTPEVTARRPLPPRSDEGEPSAPDRSVRLLQRLSATAQANREEYALGEPVVLRVDLRPPCPGRVVAALTLYREGVLVDRNLNEVELQLGLNELVLDGIEREGQVAPFITRPGDYSLRVVVRSADDPSRALPGVTPPVSLKVVWPLAVFGAQADVVAWRELDQTFVLHEDADAGLLARFLDRHADSRLYAPYARLLLAAGHVARSEWDAARPLLTALRRDRESLRGLKDRYLLLDARMLLRDGEHVLATALLDELLRDFPSSPLAGEAGRLRASGRGR